MPRRHLLPILLAGLAVPISAPASAQEFNEIQAVIKPQLNIERSRHLRQLVRERGEDLLEQRMNAAPGAGVPLFYGESDQEAVEEPASETHGWNIWFDGNGGGLEDTTPVRAYEGTQFVLTAGADTTLGERVILGGLGLHSGSNVDNTFLPGSSSTRGLGLGPYGAVFLTDTIVLTASLLHIWTDNAANSGPVTATYDSREWTANVSVTSYHFAGNWQFAPTAGISYSNERDDAYSDSAASAFAASTTETGTFAFGGKVSYTHAFANGVTLEPSLEAEGEWTFARSTTATTSVAPDMEEFDANVTAGLDVTMSESVSVSLSGTVSGLAKPAYMSATAGGRLTVSF